MRRLAAVIVVAAAAAGSVGAVLASAHTDGAALQGSVGPGFVISLKDAGGAAVTHLDPGSYTLTVNDQSDIHNFHLNGPGVDVATSVDGAGVKTFDVTLVDGTYTFVCDAHPLSMKGSFTVGAAAPPPTTTTTTTPTPPAPSVARLSLAVTDRALTLKKPGGSAVRRLRPGSYVVSVTDRSKTQNVHLSGAGVNRKTGIAFTGTAVWRLVLKQGTLVYRSDARPAKLKPGKVVVTP